jgi:hypothetical protein
MSMADPFAKPGGNFPSSLGGSFMGNPPMGSAPKQNKNQIITSLYKSILGRDPDPNALMYYISQPEIDENAVRKQMVESDEHKQILDEYKNIAGLKKEIEDLKVQVGLKEKGIKDKESEIEELNHILGHKTQEIAKVRSEVEEAKKDVVTSSKFTNTVSVVKVESLFDKIVKKLSGILRKS